MRVSGRWTPLLPVLAVVFFGPLLAWRRLGPLDFWWGMSLSLAFLIGLSLLGDKSQRLSLLQDLESGLAKKVGLGFLSALALYGIFWAGNALSRAVLPFAAKEIGAVYGLKQNANILRVGLLLLIVIGPGEELFWRGFVQRRWQKGYGRLPGWLLAAALYAAVHAGSGNLILVLSALICGLYWGAIYTRFQSLIPVAVSHTVWDILIFIFFPLG